MYHIERLQMTSMHHGGIISPLGTADIFYPECSGHNGLFPVRYPVKNRPPPYPVNYCRYNCKYTFRRLVWKTNRKRQ